MLLDYEPRRSPVPIWKRSLFWGIVGSILYLVLLWWSLGWSLGNMLSPARD